MPRISDCVKCGKVNAQHEDGTPMKPDEGLPYRLDPESVRIVLLKGDQSYRGLSDATLCSKCIQPLTDYLFSIGVLTPPAQ